MLLKTYQAARMEDPYSPTAPTLIDRRFEQNRQIPEERVKAMLVEVLSSPLAPRVAALVESRLGRPLEPFDVWYDGFRPRGSYTEEQLDAIVKKKYPSAEAFQEDIPNILVKLGFSKDRARLPGLPHPRRSRRAARATPPAPIVAPTRRISARASRRTG